MGLLKVPHHTHQEVLVTHANAALTPKARLQLARLVIDDGWPIARAAEHFHVAWPTAKRWAQRYAAMGEDGMADRSSRPHRCPHRTPQHAVKKVVHLRWKQRLSPLAIASRTGLPASTIHAVPGYQPGIAVVRVPQPPARCPSVTNTTAPARHGAVAEGVPQGVARRYLALRPARLTWRWGCSDRPRRLHSGVRP
ncbi:helix-turn-helix domain-containing protein [Streptomyces sp. NP160]|uniref:helix-turn-helix domain-containing protein n=1 Tax=Streptomyces sp. NP160 TaxID=2586637 RepID=UPI0035A6B857